jgi:hypothetical protein
LFRVSHWKLPPCDAGDDGTWVCYDDLKFIPAISDHEEGVSRQTKGGNVNRVGTGVAGNMTKARSAYQDFFTLWKNADQDIPVLKQAKAEYAKLWPFRIFPSNCLESAGCGA